MKVKLVNYLPTKIRTETQFTRILTEIRPDTEASGQFVTTPRVAVLIFVGSLVVGMVTW